MIQCPECRQMIPDDSAFCDQCGKELKWCPECKRPKRGTECPVCGSDLIPGRKWLTGGIKNDEKRDTPLDSEVGGASKSPENASANIQATALVGNGWRLTLRKASSAAPAASGRNSPHARMYRAVTEPSAEAPETGASPI